MRPWDLVVVAGYPGRTERWQTAQEMRFDYEQRNPGMIEMLGDLAAVYEKVGQQSEALKIKATGPMFGVMNYRQFYALAQESIERAGLLEERIVRRRS